MKRTGNEKRIRALFDELKRTDEKNAPVFANMLAATKTQKSEKPSLRLAFGMAAGFSGVCILTALGLFVQTEQFRRVEETPSVSPPKTEEAGFPAVRAAVIAKSRKPSVRRNFIRKNFAQPEKVKVQKIFRQRKSFARRKPPKREVLTKESLAENLLAWKSPTESLLETPVRSLLKPVKIGEIKPKAEENIKNEVKK